VKSSNNRAKARFRLAKAHAAVADKRLDHLHKFSTRLIRENQTVVLEDLNVSGMAKNHKPARAIADAGWRLLRMLLESKAQIHGREVKIISRLAAHLSNLLSLRTPGRQEGIVCPCLEEFSLRRASRPRRECLT